MQFKKTLLKISLSVVCMFFSFFSFSQIKGLVINDENGIKKPIANARIYLLQSKLEVEATKDGLFELILPKSLPDTLVVSAKGYFSDTLVVGQSDRFIALTITLQKENELTEAVISIKKSDHSILKSKTLNTEFLSAGELRKAACCNLSESFETNATVDVNVTDAVSGAKKIQMMGLDGVYTQIQMENIPYLRGLESSFGLNSIPGTWIESIQITKGTGNVVNGYESMAGLVNLELKKPLKMEQIYLNSYVNRFGRLEFNANAGHKISEKWSTGWFAHASGMTQNMDNNKDGFRDMPKGSNYAFMNRWSYTGKKFEAQIGINAYTDTKLGGQLPISNSNLPLYGVEMHAKHADMFAKTGFLFENKPYQSIGIVYNLKHQQVDAIFGHRTFSGEEKRGYVNAIYDGIITNTNHKIKTGLSFVYIDLKQEIDSFSLMKLSNNRIEIVPGIFGEYTYTGSRWTSVWGGRVDYHNLFGLQVSPRIHAKYLLTEKIDLRLTAGKGWRVPNFMMDNISLLATSRNWLVTQKLQPEISWNIGTSLVYEFQLLTRKSTLTVDLYHTEFQNQLVVDRDSLVGSIVFKNLVGRSFSNSIQTEFSFSPFINFEVRMAYKLLDVRTMYGGVVQQQVMLPKHRGFVNLSYKTRNKRWEFDATCTVFGQSRLPIVTIGGSELAQATKSQVYAMINAQVTHVYKRFNFYLGGENLGNYRQKNPIIDAQNPFGNNFEATRIWGPIMGVNLYAGFRFAINRKKEKV